MHLKANGNAWLWNRKALDMDLHVTWHSTWEGGMGCDRVREVEVIIHRMKNVQMHFERTATSVSVTLITSFRFKSLTRTLIIQRQIKICALKIVL